MKFETDLIFSASSEMGGQLGFSHSSHNISVLIVVRQFYTVRYLVAPDISACQCWLIPGPPEALCGDGG